MAVLTKDEILSADDLKRERVELPEWGDEDSHAYVRTMTGRERDAYEENCQGDGGLRNIRARLVALTLCDENGERLFTDVEANKLGDRSSLALNRVCRIAQRLSGLTGQDVEDLAKNSEPGPSEDGG